MAENNPLITLEEAYWWLNDAETPFLRPPLHELLERLSQAEQANDKQAAEFICAQFADRELNFLPPPVQALFVKLYNAVKAWLARDIETARQKLNDSGGSYLRNPTYVYVLKMRAAVDQDPANAWVPLDRLVTLCTQIADDLEAGETLVECGLALYKLQKHKRALQLFQAANRRYTSYNHQVAVVYWMIGCIQWEAGQHDKALATWRKSLSRFEVLASQRITQASSDTKWYRDILQKLNASVEYTAEHESASRAPTAASSEAGSGETASTVAEPAKLPNGAGANQANESVASLQEVQPVVTFTGDLLEALPVLAEIPAGPWKQTRGDRNILGQVTINQVWINNEPHFVKNLRGGHTISLASIEKHVVIKISGDSMNAAQPTPIEDGDYVLLRRQNTAQAGDIVVAKILDQATSNPLTTIKRFLIDGHPLLKAESTDPKYGKLDDEFKIDGLAVAVFKPVYQKGKSDTEPL